jgi:hypothetical protein
LGNFAKRVDENQKEIVKAFREIGASVQILSDVGKGCPDLLIGFAGRNWLIEIKNGNKPPSQQQLTEKEQQFFNTWRGQVCIIRSIEQARFFFKNSLNVWSVLNDV